MLFHHDLEDEKLIKEIQKHGVINDLDVSNKEKAIKLALRLAVKQIK